MNQPQETEKAIRKIKCAECDFEVRASDENELLTVIQTHEKRKHDQHFTRELPRAHRHEVKVKA